MSTRPPERELLPAPPATSDQNNRDHTTYAPHQVFSWIGNSPGGAGTTRRLNLISDTHNHLMVTNRYTAINANLIAGCLDPDTGWTSHPECYDTSRVLSSTLRGPVSWFKTYEPATDSRWTPQVLLPLLRAGFTIRARPDATDSRPFHALFTPRQETDPLPVGLVMARNGRGEASMCWADAPAALDLLPATGPVTVKKYVDAAKTAYRLTAHQARALGQLAAPRG